MKIIGMLPVHNEEDIIEEAIQHLLSQGLELVVLDNGSTDKTFQICEKFLDKGVLKLEQFKSTTFQYITIVRMLYDMAIFENPDWVIRSDTDQLLESGMNMTLKDAISQADAEGYNIIQFDEFNFYMTEEDNESAKSIKEKLLYYSYDGDFYYKSWKFVPGILVTGFSIAGHFPIFPPGEVYKTFPKKFIIRHYPFRSKQQAKNRIQERLSRIPDAFYRPGKIFPIHKVVQSDYSSSVDHKLLTKYNEGDQWNLEKKYTPYSVEEQLTRDQLISKEGLLKIFEVEADLKQKKSELVKAESKIAALENIIDESLNEKKL